MRDFSISNWMTSNFAPNFPSLPTNSSFDINRSSVLATRDVGCPDSSNALSIAIPATVAACRGSNVCSFAFNTLIARTDTSHRLLISSTRPS